MDRHEYLEAIAEQVEYYKSVMPPEIKDLIGKANADLYSGPLYIDKDGNECSCFDEDAKPFDFKKACKKLSEYTDTIEDIREETDCDEETGESQYENIDGSGRDIIKQLLGKELSKYV